MPERSVTPPCKECVNNPKEQKRQHLSSIWEGQKDRKSRRFSFATESDSLFDARCDIYLVQRFHFCLAMRLSSAKYGHPQPEGSDPIRPSRVSIPFCAVDEICIRSAQESTIGGKNNNKRKNASFHGPFACWCHSHHQILSTLAQTQSQISRHDLLLSSYSIEQLRYLELSVRQTPMNDAPSVECGYTVAPSGGIIVVSSGFWPFPAVWSLSSRISDRCANINPS